MLTGKEKRDLRAQGHLLKAEIWLGREGITEGLLHSLKSSFHTKELVKVKLQKNCPLDRKEAAERLCEELGAELVQILGNTLLLFRRSAEE